MKYAFIATLTVLLIVPVQGFAQEASVCGGPPPVANESLKGEILGKAQFLSKYLGDAQLGGKIETSRTEIFSKYPDAEKSRANAYYEYQVCVLLMNDRRMTTKEKLDELRKIRQEFQKPIVNKYPVVFRSASSMYDNRQLGAVEGSYSWVEFKIDDRLVTKHWLDKPFGSHKVVLVEGDHTFEMNADIEAGYASVKDNCQGVFSVSRPTTFQPRVVFKRVSQFDGKITDCSLTEID